MGAVIGGPTGPSDAALLRKAPDIVQTVYPCSDGDAHVLQFGGGENSVVFNEGGPLVWMMLALCDGTRTIGEVTAQLRAKFSGPESLWTHDILKLLDQLLAWRAVEAVSGDPGEEGDGLG